MPARIDVHPLQDVSAISYLGERLAEERPIVKDWVAGSPAAVAFDTDQTPSERYRLAAAMRLESLYPILQGYKNTGAVGYRVNLSDPLQFNRASITMSSCLINAPIPWRPTTSASYFCLLDCPAANS